MYSIVYILDQNMNNYFMRWKHTKDIDRYCACQNNTPQPTGQNTSTNTVQQSARTRYAQYIRQHSRGTSYNSNMSGGGGYTGPTTNSCLNNVTSGNYSSS
jgi:hypothetical protein